MTNAVWEFPLTLPRNAFTAREVPRAGDIWRLCQDVATLASIRAGWPPARFRQKGIAFIVYRMTMLHEASTTYGAVLDTKTWVSRLRRRMLSTREVRVRDEGRPVAAATQEWVHVDFDTMKPRKASGETAAAFPEIDLEPSVQLPAFQERQGKEHLFSFEMWQTWSDPLAHANHPAYVDWCDEAISRHMVAGGIDPVLLRPIAEQVRFRSAVVAGEEIEVRTTCIGALPASAVVLRHELSTANGIAADAITMRGLAEGSGEDFVALWE